VTLGILLAIFFVLVGLVSLAAAPKQQKLGMVGFLELRRCRRLSTAAVGVVARSNWSALLQLGSLA
jgi:hypothetical protein